MAVAYASCLYSITASLAIRHKQCAAMEATSHVYMPPIGDQVILKHSTSELASRHDHKEACACGRTSVCSEVLAVNKARTYVRDVFGVAQVVLYI